LSAPAAGRQSPIETIATTSCGARADPPEGAGPPDTYIYMRVYIRLYKCIYICIYIDIDI